MELRRKVNGWKLITIILIFSNIVLFLWCLYQISNYHNKYNMLEKSYHLLELDYNALEENYSLLKQEKTNLEAWYNSIKNQINLRSLGEDRKLFVTPEDPTVNNLVTQITGRWSSTINLESRIFIRLRFEPFRLPYIYPLTR
ncbi:MAG: hypothetical protein RMI79_06620 [Nitrososphaerota archaeon]|nr:hypothetical protein [Nitrososphaerota archaeon]